MSLQILKGATRLCNEEAICPVGAFLPPSAPAGHLGGCMEFVVHATTKGGGVFRSRRYNDGMLLEVYAGRHHVCIMTKTSSRWARTTTTSGPAPDVEASTASCDISADYAELMAKLYTEAASWLRLHEAMIPEVAMTKLADSRQHAEAKLILAREDNARLLAEIEKLQGRLAKASDHRKKAKS